jgi:acetylornithine deacetylase/succinyl-diaminopimelate desuccinylase-like protein
MRVQQVEAYLRERRDEHLRQLMDFLRIPSVSALSEHRSDVRRAAEWLAAELRRIGLNRVEVMETGGHPVVYAERLDNPGGPTALIYGHYDVQPVDPEALWTTPPFEPNIRNGRIYARGASDDKGQVFMHMRALKAHLATRGRLPLNVRLVIEGEEEVGSESLGRYVESAPELKADVVVISDTSMPAIDAPAICYSLRGIAVLEMTVRGAASDLHSGLFGGAVPNPLHELARLVASLHDDAGRVNVPGFYDDVLPLTAEERAMLARLPFDEEEYKASLGLKELYGEAGYTTIERIGARPTLELNGMWGGFQGEGSKTVIPAEAHAKITCRLVPDQDPEKIADLVASALAERAHPSVTVDVRRGHGGAPWICSPDDPAIQAGMRALEQAFAASPLLMRMGGSIPVVGNLDRVLRAPIVLMGFALPTDQVHAPNENFSLQAFDKGSLALALYWDELARALA